MKKVKLTPKIKKIMMYYDDLEKEEDIALKFPLMDFLMKPSGIPDKKLIDELELSGLLNKMKKNFKGNHKNNKKIKIYNILLDNHEWLECRMIGTDN